MSTYAAKDSVFMYDSHKIEARRIVNVHSVALLLQALFSAVHDAQNLQFTLSEASQLARKSRDAWQVSVVNSEPPDVFWENLAVSEGTIRFKEWTAGCKSHICPCPVKETSWASTACPLWVPSDCECTTLLA